MLTSRWFGGDPDDVLAVEQDLALGRLLEAADHPQRRRLAAAGRAEQREELALADHQVDPLDRGDDAATGLEVLGDADQLDGGDGAGVDH